ncbi:MULTISPECIES: hypothetical protein [Anaeromyxobacter]|uniref:hypothetical protein n=1 Tax=Anaeromyxobacter TaxID=161492 RepID=UPI001F5A8D78|nr:MULTISPECIES: hypothetical protein [unclassified Anaeromyxobacter]
MARIDMEDFVEGTEIARVYLAATLEEAQAVEAALEDAGFEFAIELETFASPTALGSNQPRRGAGFWVEASAATACIGALERAGHLRGLAERE